MKSFLIILKNKSQATLPMSLLKEHVAHLTGLYTSGHLQTCGPFADDSGAMLVIDASNRNEVDAMIQADPFIKERYYSDYSITEFYKAEAANHWLMEHESTQDELNRK